LRARFYNPVIGRFIQEDIYRGDGLNLYAYCGNNPVVYYDPSGYESASKVRQFQLDPKVIDEVLSTPKGKRPDPSTYLSKDYIDKHLSQFKDGGSFVMTKKQYEMFVEQQFSFKITEPLKSVVFSVI
jgi:hypothetical protein